MVTKADLKIEAARLATESVNEAREKGEKLEFTPLAEEIYNFLQKDLDLKDTDDPQGMVSQVASMIGGMNWNNISPKQTEDGSAASQCRWYSGSGCAGFPLIFLQLPGASLY